MQNALWTQGVFFMAEAFLTFQTVLTMTFCGKHKTLQLCCYFLKEFETRPIQFNYSTHSGSWSGCEK